MNRKQIKHLKKLKFGPAGKPIGFKGRVEEVPAFLNEKGLDAFEVQQVRQINIKEEQAKLLREAAKKYKIILSVHAPYAINLSSTKSDTLEASKERLLRTLQLAEKMGAYVVVFHPGYYGKLDPSEALKIALKAIEEIEEEAKGLGIKRVRLGAETMGKKSQLGSLDEVIEMAKSSDLVMPVIDFAHLHARTGGKFNVKESYESVLDKLEEELGDEAKRLHIHFSKIEYSDKGERKHHPFGTGFGPRFIELAETLMERGIETVIISESPKLDVDALKMQEIVTKLALKKYKNKKELEKLE